MKYIVKIDISGIQKFIFDIPSKEAGKQLKARSFYVYALTHIIFKMLQDKIGDDNVKLIYNGGGNLFVYANTEREVLEDFRSELEGVKDFQGVLFPFISFVENQQDFKSTMSLLNKEVLKTKLRRNFSTQVFEKNRQINWKKLVYQLIDNNGFRIKKGTPSDGQIYLGDYVLEFNKEDKQFEGNVLNKMPRSQQNTITEFEDLARKAYEAQADEKIAALKMDVDNLGMLFRNREEEQYNKLSKAMENFFSKELYQKVLKEKIEQQELYPVFAGGDDLFFIGSWHKMIEVAKEINERFGEYQKDLNLKQKITLSAGLIITNEKYPLIRIAEEAEEALELAKNYRIEKNSICIFGQPMGWEELDKSEEIKNKLKRLLENGESKALLQRIKSSDLGFRSLQDKILNTNKIDLPKVYRLKYYLRNAKNEQNRQELTEIFNKYSDDLLNDFLEKKKQSNPAKYVVAARWIELLLRNKN
ncbi:MAG: CRISPR-associated protein Cas10 [Flavobacteriaceae bacterium]|nr:CRISPR-associated protein Cas10 [Flavobacteriaceae bacterium]